ncbi:MAG: hypothetical protein AB8E82_11400 [Aureispira sp.]
MLLNIFKTGQKFTPVIRTVGNNIKKTRVQTNVKKFKRNYSTKPTVIELEEKMTKVERLNFDLRDLTQYQETYNLNVQQNTEQADFLNQVRLEIPKLEQQRAEILLEIERLQNPILSELSGLNALDLDFNFDELLPFEIRGDDLVLSRQSRALAIYETPITALRPYRIDPSELMIIPEQEVGLIPFEEREAALMVIPEQETALALFEERETALTLWEEQEKALMVIPKKETGLVEVEKDPEPLSMYERIKIVKGAYKTIKAIIKDDSAILLGDLKKLKNLPKVGKHFQTIKDQGVQFEKSYQKYKRGSSKQEKMDAATEMLDAALKITKALMAILGLLFLLRKMYKSYKELNAAVKNGNKQAQAILKTQYDELADLVDSEQNAEALRADIAEQMENASEFWDFIQRVGVCLGGLEQTDLQKLGNQLEVQQGELENLRTSIITRKDEIYKLEEQGDVTIEEALVVNTQAFHNDLTTQIEAIVDSIKKVPNDVKEIKTVYDNLKKINKVPIIDSSREIRE